MTALEDEAREAYERFVECRNEIDAGKRPWTDLGEFFTDDCVFVDPAWGRTEGKGPVITFLERSMAGLDGWSFPEQWTVVSGNRVISLFWNRLPGTRPDGTPLQAPGVSILHYAGEGKFSFECDVLNMAEVGELMARSPWKPNASMFAPPRVPNRDCTPPRGMGTP
jgi:ketosteroid isomerase-like protein